MKIKNVTIITIVLLATIRALPTQQRYTTNAQNSNTIDNYENSEYEQSVEAWKELADNCQGFSFCGEILHNLGNAYFFLGKETADSEQQKAYRYQALQAYSGALAINDDLQTQHNHDEVAKLLGEPTSEESDENQESSESGEDNQEQQEAGEKGEEGEQNSDQQGSENSEEGGEQQGTEESDESSQGQSESGEENNEEGEPDGSSDQPSEQPSALSENQQLQLEQYAQMLEQQQLQNQQFFNKEQQANQDPFEAIFGIPSLRQQINPNSNQKDW